MTGGSVCQRSLVCPSKVQVSCVWDANCHISFYNSLAGSGPTRAAPGPFPEKGLDQKGQKVGYPPSALPPGTLKPYGVSLPFTRRFSPMRRGRTLAAPPSYPVGAHSVRPRLCRRFPLSCTAFHFFDSLPPRSKMTGGQSFIGFGLAEVALQQALESLAVAGNPHGTSPMGTPMISSARAE